MMDLLPLDPIDLQQVYEWDNGSAFEPYESYQARLLGDNWCHWAILQDDAFIGCISLELFTLTSCGLHLCMRPGAARLHDLKQTLLNLGQILFDNGFTSVTAEIRSENRAARLLAALCGMRKAFEDSIYATFRMTNREFYVQA